MRRQAEHIYQFGPFCLNAEERQLVRDGTAVTLTAKAFDTLLTLVQNSGHILEKDELLKTIWPDTFVEEATLAQNIFLLRKALGEKQNGHRYIDTIPKHGYRFVADVRKVEHASAPPAMKNAEVSTNATQEEQIDKGQIATAEKAVRGFEQNKLESRATISSRVKWSPPTAFLVICMLVGIPVIYFWTSSKSKEPERAALIRSMAVLPFKTLGTEGSEDYLGLGMADALINRLGHIHQIVLRPTNSIRKYDVAGQDPVIAGRELGVDAVVEGNIQRQGERVRVTVHLIRVPDGVSLWTEKFDDKFTDLFAMEDRLSIEIAQALTQPLSSDEQRLLAKHSTENAEAYQEYLKGRYFWNKRSEEGYQKALEYFGRAIEKDPAYAQAHAGLADSYALLGAMGNASLPARQAIPRAKAAALKALEIDDTLAEAHTSLAFVHMHYEWDWPRAEKEFKRAIELNANYATAHHWYAYCLTAMGRPDDAIAEAKRAHEIDPLSLVINTDVGEILLFARRHDEAMEQARKTLELDPNFPLARQLLGWAYVRKGMFTEAIAELQSAVSGRADIITDLGHVYAIAGRRDEARQILNRLLEQSKQRYVPPHNIATLYAGLGEKDRAFAWLEKAYEEHSGSLILLRVTPALDSLHSDPRFVDLSRRVGLAQ